MQQYRMLIYLGIFLLITIVGYSFCPKAKRYIVLLTSSILFYAVYSKFAVIYLIITIITTYTFSNVIGNVKKKYDLTGLEKEEKKRIKAIIKSRKKLLLIIYMIVNIGILAIVKYFNFFADCTVGFLNIFELNVNAPVIKIILPLGISYYTLQALGYVIDVYRGKYLPDKNFLKLGLFIGFFPQLYEGPFGRYDDLIPQMISGDKIKSENVYSGILKILWGLFKLFMISNRAAIIADTVFKNYNQYGGIITVIGVAAFTIQLYAEFSGYIDISTGISEIFGVKLAANFDMPFLSQNVGEFWRRWHISLGTWFRDYVFYSVSTSKKFNKLGKKIKNAQFQNFIIITSSMFVVWFLTGLWHGASEKYIVYGLYYFVLMVLFNLLNPHVEKALERFKISSENKIVKTIRIAKTLILVGIGMMIFRAPNMNEFSKMFLSIFNLSKQGASIVPIIELKDLIALIVSLAVLIYTAVLKLKNKDFVLEFNTLSPYKKYWVCFVVFCIVVIFGAYGFGYLPPDPIYGGF